jgi:type II secretory pathway component GspD/PulD (secretin)
MLVVLMAIPLGRDPVAAQDSTAAVSESPAAAPAPTLKASQRDGRVTLSAQDTPLVDVLSEFSRVSGIHIYLEASVSADEATTIAFENLPPEDGLRRLLRAKNFMFVYSGGGLSEVRVYTDGKGQFQKLSTDGRASKFGVPTRARRTADAKPSEESPSTAMSNEDREEALRMRTQALSNPDPDERSAGLEELVSIEDHQLAVDTAMKVLETERVSDVLQSALNIFSGVETAPIEPVLAFINAGRAQESSVRIQALEFLSDRGAGDPRVRELLSQLAKNDSDKDVRESAQNLLEDFQN